MASQYPSHDNAVDDVLDDEAVTDNESLDETDTEVTRTAGRRDGREDFSVAARQRLREELARQVEAFLARGGHIHEVPTNLNNTKPRKPVSDYGDRMM